MSESIKYSLTENALDYLILAGEQAKLGGPRMLKHAMANLADGVELLLKARLEMHDWEQLFQDPAKADRRKYEEGDFQSAYLDEIMKRLRKQCSLTFDDKSRSLINSLKTTRNRIRHFRINVDEEVAVSLLVKAFAFAIEFTTEHIEYKHDEFCPDELTKLRLLLTEFQPYVDNRLKDLQPTLSRHEPFVDCPVCLQRAFVPDGSGDGSRCHFCGLAEGGAFSAWLWVERFGPMQSPKEQTIDPPIENCPECGEEAFVNVSKLADLDEIGYLCFSCGEWGDYRRCSSCGNPFSGDEAVCSDCIYEKSSDE